MNTTIGSFDISAGFTSLHKWTHFKIHRRPRDRVWHLIWGRFSLHIDDWTAEVYALCAECGSDEIGEVSAGDEGLTVCQSCRSVEGGYRYVNKREFEEGGR